MDESQGLSVLLDNTKPPGSVCRVRRFVYSTLNLVLDNLDNFVVDCGGNRDIPLYPWGMRNSGDPDRREILLLKPTTFTGIPDECELVRADDPLQQLQFFGPKPLRRVEVKCVRAFLGITDSRSEFRRVDREVEKTFEWIIG